MLYSLGSSEWSTTDSNRTGGGSSSPGNNRKNLFQKQNQPLLSPPNRKRRLDSNVTRVRPSTRSSSDMSRGADSPKSPSVLNLYTHRLSTPKVYSPFKMPQSQATTPRRSVSQQADPFSTSIASNQKAMRPSSAPSARSQDSLKRSLSKLSLLEESIVDPSEERVKIVMQPKEDRVGSVLFTEDPSSEPQSPSSSISTPSKQKGKADYSSVKSKYLQKAQYSKQKKRVNHKFEEERKVQLMRSNPFAINPVFIPSFNTSATYLDEIVHHSKIFLTLENKYLFNCESMEERNLNSKCQYFPCNWRGLPKDDLMEACNKLMYFVDTAPCIENLAVLFTLLQSTYLLPYFVSQNIIGALSNWILVHPPSLVTQWHFRILRKTKWYTMFGIDPDSTLKHLYFTEELKAILVNMATHQTEVDPLLSTKAFSVLRYNLERSEVIALIQNVWKDTVKKGFPSTFTGMKLLANNYLHTVGRYREVAGWDIYHHIVEIIIENVDEEETLKAIENLIHLAEHNHEGIILSGGFKVCLQNLNHEKTKIRNHILLLLRALCENSASQFMIFPYNMNIIFQLTDFMSMDADIPIQVNANAFHAISSMLQNSIFKSSEKIQDFHVVHTQSACQGVLHHNFDSFTDAVVDLINGAAECLHFVMVDSIERATYALNSGMLQRVVHLIETGPSTIYPSLLNLIVPLCASRLSTEIVFEVDDHLLNPLLLLLKKISHDPEPRIQNAARQSLLRLADILSLDKFQLFKEYKPSNVKYRYMGLPDNVVERTRKSEVQFNEKNRKKVAEYMKNVSFLSDIEDRPKSQSSHASYRSYSRLEDLSSYIHYRNKLDNENYYVIDDDFFKRNRYTDFDDEEFRSLLKISSDEKESEQGSILYNSRIDHSKSPYASLPILLTCEVDSPPFPEDIALSERRELERRLKDEKEFSELMIVTTNMDSVLAFRKTPRGAKAMELVRMCSYCGNIYLSIVYRCFNCNTMFCSTQCRKDALENCHLACKLVTRGNAPHR